MIRWKESELNELKTVINDYNKKVMYYQQKWPDIYLPPPESIETIKNYKYRKDYRKKLHEMKDFISTDLKTVMTPGGVKTTDYQVKQMLNDAKRLHYPVNLQSIPPKYFNKVLEGIENRKYLEKSEILDQKWINNYKKGVKEIFGDNHLSINLINLMDTLPTKKILDLLRNDPIMTITYYYGPDLLMSKYAEIRETLMEAGAHL